MPPARPEDARTLPQLIRAAAAYGEEVAITLAGEGVAEQQASFAALDRRSAALARGLVARGVGKGARIGFIHGNGPEFAVAFAAIGRIGAVAVPISTMIRADELVRVLRRSDVAGLIVQRTMLGHDLVARLCDALPALREADPDLRLPEAPYLRWIVSTGTGLPPAIRDLAWLEDAAGSVAEGLLAAIEAEVAPSDQLVEIYTSGSMALPKGVRHDHGPVLHRSRYLAAGQRKVRGQVEAAVMPMFWVGGLGLHLLVNWVAGVATACTERTMSNARLAMGTVLAEEDLALLRGLPRFWALGMSETFGPYSYGDELRAPGYPLCPPLDHVADGFEVRVVGDAGAPVGDGGVGEIEVRGYALTPGLHKLERAGFFTADGFYRTGDLGRVEGARIHFVGRSGDMIKTAGSNVSPAEVELELQRLEGVQSSYVVGLPDAERGQLVVAALVARAGAALDLAAVEALLRERLSPYKVPRAYVALAPAEVPLLASNKVSRRQLQALLAERLGRPPV